MAAARTALDAAANAGSDDGAAALEAVAIINRRLGTHEVMRPAVEVDETCVEPPMLSLLCFQLFKPRHDNDMSPFKVLL